MTKKSCSRCWHQRCDVMRLVTKSVAKCKTPLAPTNSTTSAIWRNPKITPEPSNRVPVYVTAWSDKASMRLLLLTDIQRDWRTKSPSQWTANNATNCHGEGTISKPTRDQIPDDARAMVRTSNDLGHRSLSPKFLRSC